LKGGSTYTTGGANAGTWNNSTGLSDDGHNHKWYESNAQGVNDQVWDTDGDLETLSAGAYVAASDYHIRLSQTAGEYKIGDSWTNNASASISSDSSWRPAASVGTLQYLDL
jgi:hypothetical protein